MLHIGGVRTALFNYLLARHFGGDFVLRIEDTDRERLVEGGVTQILESLKWLDLVPDEGPNSANQPYGPYVQSERKERGIYLDYAEQLVAEGKAYYSAITPEAFNDLKQQAIEAKKPFVYRQSMEPQDATMGHSGLPIRLKVGPGELLWQDEVHGEFKVDHEIIEDFVIMKADGFPMYNFANVVDDHLMQISHVVRGPEFLASTPKHVLLYDYFGWHKPKFAHCPAILGPDGKKKLSKRDGDVDAREYREKGYLPSAVINFLAMLGWNDGTTKEIFTFQELVDAFSLERMQKSPAQFDVERLNWMNGEYIRNVLSEQEYLAAAREALEKADYAMDGFGSKYTNRVLLLDRERVKVLGDIPHIVEFFFVPPRWGSEQLSLLTAKSSGAEVADWLKQAVGVIQDTDGSEQAIEQALRKLSEAQSIHTGKLFYALRIAITGRTAAPGLFETIATLGTEEAVQRLEKAASVLTRA